MRVLALLLVTLFGLSACGSPDFARAHNRITEFHKDYNDQEYDTIYKTADAELRDSRSYDDFAAMLAKAHERLGSESSTASIDESFRPGLHGTYMTLNVRTHFEKGEAQEEFVYVMRDDAVLLTDYRIESAALTGP